MSSKFTPWDKFFACLAWFTPSYISRGKPAAIQQNILIIGWNYTGVTEFCPEISCWKSSQKIGYIRLRSVQACFLLPNVAKKRQNAHKYLILLNLHHFAHFNIGFVFSNRCLSSWCWNQNAERYNWLCFSPTGNVENFIIPFQIRLYVD